MGLLDRFRAAAPSPTSSLTALAETERAQYQDSIALLETDMAQLERSLAEPGWQQIATLGEHTFTREGLRRIAALCRVMRTKNPLCRRASAIKGYYVWGQGVEVSARDEDVNDVVRDLIEDPTNQRAVFGSEARERLERTLHTDSNVFLASWSHPRTGRVQVRPIPFDEIESVVKNPDDAAEPWFYVRRWWQHELDVRTATTTPRLMEALYPDIDYRPRTRPASHGGMPIRWDSPILHLAVNRDGFATFGVPELYPALDWARAHTEFLDDWRKIVRGLSKFAWKAKTKGSQVPATRTRMASATADDAPAGQTFVGDHATDLQPVKHTGASVNVADHRAFALMVSAATDVPETMLLGDPSTGNLATATTLDRPTELAFQTRRGLWADVYRRLAQHAVERSVMATAGELRGTVRRDEWDRLRVEVAGDVESTVDVEWPPIVEHDIADYAKAIKDANEAGMPLRETVRLLLVAFEIDNADEILSDMEDAGAFDEQAPVVGDEFMEAVASLSEAVAGLGA